MSLKIGIHEFENGIFTKWSEKYIDILRFNNIPYELLSIDDLDFWNKIRDCTHFIYHWGGITDEHQKANSILPVIEFELNKPCFPNWRLSWHYDDKIKGYYILKAHSFPVVATNIFYNKVKAIEWVVSKASFPIVLKLKRGAGSQDVIKIDEREYAIKIINKLFGSGIISGHIPGNDIWLKQFSLKKSIEKYLRSIYRQSRGLDFNRNYYLHKNYVLFQSFLPNNSFDTRVSIIGNRAFAFRRFNRDNDFRASGSGKIDYNIDQIDIRCVEIAFRVSKTLTFSNMSYDFIFFNNEPHICEISYTFQDIAVYKCPGFWDQKLKWHAGNFWPEHLQLIDFLHIPDLIYPDFTS